MKKYFLIPQYPIAEHFTLLVDFLSDNFSIGATSDIDKCLYNRQVIDSMGIDINMKILIYTAQSDKGSTFIQPVGRYIAIMQISRDETSQTMTFIDSFMRKELFREANNSNKEYKFSENIVNEFERIHSLLRESFEDEFDLVELSLFTDSL